LHQDSSRFKMRKKSLLFIVGLLFSALTFSQPHKILKVCKELSLKIDTSVYYLSENTINYKGEKHLYFNYTKDDEICEINFIPSPFLEIKTIQLLPSGDYDQVDSLSNFNNDYYRAKIKFKSLAKSQFLSLVFKIKTSLEPEPIVYEVRLFPYTQTYVKFYPTNEELFIGEEKSFELITNNLSNISISNNWTTGEDIDYRIAEKNGQLILHILPNTLGTRTLNLKIQTSKPFIDATKNPVYDLPVITQTFKVKASRLAYLNIDQREVTLDDESKKEGIVLQLDNNRQLQLKKTYRIEDQEEPGGALIAEIFTKSALASDKILCILRPYNYHRSSEGYLYLKDGDRSLFISNLSITPRTNIQKISVMHEGKEWTTSTNLYPGETVDVKVEGEGLHKAKFHWEDLTDITSDTSIRNENLVLFKLKVPMNINKKSIALYNYTTNTGHTLSIKEFQDPAPFDYIYLNYGDKNRSISGLRGPIVYAKPIKDLSLVFLDNKIDSEKKLYGKQYLDIDVRVSNINGMLLDLKNIQGINVCPGESSPRAAFYDKSNCGKNEVSLNNFLSSKTFDNTDWVKYEIDIKNPKDKYSGEGNTKHIELIQQRPYRFDIDVSFPAGLLVKNVKDTVKGYNNLYGISLAIIAQFSFYSPNSVGKLRPYKIGAGFLALNAFDFSSTNSQRDMSFVILASLFPTRRDAKLSFPLYLGYGYKFSERKLFYMIGPGIYVRL
jgi:hypothetical protein